MAVFDVRVGMRLRGNYVAADAYEPLDLVRYQGAIYLNNVACTGVLPTDTTKFSFYLSDGAAGTNGTDGTNGTNGTNGATIISATLNPATGMLTLTTG